MADEVVVWSELHGYRSLCLVGMGGSGVAVATGLQLRIFESHGLSFRVEIPPKKYERNHRSIRGKIWRGPDYILIVDDFVDTGETFRTILRRLKQNGQIGLVRGVAMLETSSRNGRAMEYTILALGAFQKDLTMTVDVFCADND